MKKITIIVFFMAAVSAMAQNRVFDTISFIRGGKLYKLILGTNDLQVNEHVYCSFPGFGESHTTSAYGDHAHSIYETAIVPGTTEQYWRGDKTWQTLPGAGSTAWIAAAGNIYYNGGHVGVGVTNPTDKFHVKTTTENAVLAQTTTGTAFNASTTTGYAAIFMGGNVGIGLTNPSKKLHVKNASTAITGESTTSYGVQGSSVGNYAVFGTSSTSHGGHFESTSGHGLYGSSVSGYGGYFKSTTNYSLFASGKIWLDSLLFIRYMPMGTSSMRIVVWDTLTKQMKKYPMPPSLATWAGSTSITTVGTLNSLSVDNNLIKIIQSKRPSSANDNGEIGSVCWDADYIYVCVASNSWKRVLITNQGW
jgi:hypothetical protein